MHILIFEDNLIWSTRLLRTLKALGHEAEVAKHVPESPDTADAAIVNLGAPELMALVPQLREAGMKVIGHAGHKEKDLHALGKEVGCDVLATNSELTFKIEAVLLKAAG